MKGIELSEQYYFQIGAPMIQESFADYENRIATGLVGDGSECFGYDDELSRDHDWGPAFCIWLTESDFKKIGPQLQSALEQLPQYFQGFGPRRQSEWGGGRVGVFETGQFYHKFIGLEREPESLQEWRRIPEINLAAATNGKVFADPLGEFTTFRETLRMFYPEDVRLKKIASRCMTISQAGQYNYPRCINRGEYVAAQWTETKFITDSISLIFLLNRKYRPFFKWMHRALNDLPTLGQTAYDLFSDLVNTHAYSKKADLIERISRLLIEELRTAGLSDSASDFLLDHGPVVQQKIQDEQLRISDVWVE